MNHLIPIFSTQQINAVTELLEEVNINSALLAEALKLWPNASAALARDQILSASGATTTALLTVLSTTTEKETNDEEDEAPRDENAPANENAPATL